MLLALSELSRTSVLYHCFTQWHHKVFKYFIDILSPIYRGTAERAKHLQKVILHQVHRNIFAFSPQTAKLSHCFHTVSSGKSRIAPSISKEHKSKLNSKSHLCIFSLGAGGKKKGVLILDITLFISKERWPPRIGSLDLLKNQKCFLQKSITFCTLLSKDAKDTWTTSIIPLQKVQCT